MSGFQFFCYETFINSLRVVLGYKIKQKPHKRILEDITGTSFDLRAIKDFMVECSIDNGKTYKKLLIRLGDYKETNYNALKIIEKEEKKKSVYSKDIYDKRRRQHGSFGSNQ